jgi:hypothetical protein
LRRIFLAFFFSLLLYFVASSLRRARNTTHCERTNSVACTISPTTFKNFQVSVDYPSRLDNSRRRL